MMNALMATTSKRSLIGLSMAALVACDPNLLPGAALGPETDVPGGMIGESEESSDTTEAGPTEVFLPDDASDLADVVDAGDMQTPMDSDGPSKIGDAKPDAGSPADAMDVATDVVQPESLEPDASLDGGIPQEVADTTAPMDTLDVLDATDSTSTSCPKDGVGEAWTCLQPTPDDPSLPACIPAAALTDLPAAATTVTPCWTQQWAGTKMSSFSRLHVFPSGAWLVYDGTDFWRVKNQGTIVESIGIPATKVAEGLAAPPVIASARNGSAAVVRDIGDAAEIIWLGSDGMIDGKAVVKLPSLDYRSAVLDTDGFLFISVTNLVLANGQAVGSGNGIVGLHKGTKSGWFLPSDAEVYVTSATVNGDALTGQRDDDYLPERIRLLSKEGKWLTKPIVANLDAAMPDGQGGLYATIVTSLGKYSWWGFSIGRFNACGEAVWVDPFLTTQIDFGVGLLKYAATSEGSYVTNSADILRTQAGVAYARVLFARWTADGRRLPIISWHNILPKDALGNLTWSVPVASAPGGGYYIATAKLLAHVNEAASTTCKGCGPPTPTCDDGDPCAADACSAQLADCVHTAIPGCKKALGSCISDADCDDGQPCTADTCAKATGGCSHAALTKCVLGNRCVGQDDEGTCVQGKCVPPAYSKAKLPPVDGWIARLDSARPRVVEAKGGELLVAGGWYASRFQANGVVRWRKQVDSQIAAATGTPEDGLLLAMKPLGPAPAGTTRLMRLSAQGHVVADVLAQTGLAHWHPIDPWHERKRWLVTRPQGGFAFVGTQAWTADAWQGRVVELSATGQVTAALDVTLADLPGPLPQGRGIDQVWPAPDGGLYMGWHRLAPGKHRTWGAARLSAAGQVLWSQPLVANNMRIGGFDPWRPRGVAVTQGDVVRKVALLPGGVAPAVVGDATHFGLGPISESGLENVFAYAELPGERTAVAAYGLLQGKPAQGDSNWIGAKATWPPYDPAFYQQWQDVNKQLYDVIGGPYDAVDVVRAWLSLFGHAIADVHVMSDKRVVLSLSHPPGFYLYPALIVLDGNARFRPCGKHTLEKNCTTWPASPCLWPKDG